MTGEGHAATPATAAAAGSTEGALRAGSSSPRPTDAYRLLALVELAWLAALVLAFRDYDRSVHHSAVRGAPAWWTDAFYLGQAASLWGGGLAGVWLLHRLRAPSAAARGAFCLYFTALGFYLYADLICVHLYGVHLGRQLAATLLEPGAMRDVSLTGARVARLGALVAAAFAAQLAFFPLERRFARWRAARLVPAFRHQLAVACLAAPLSALAWSGYSFAYPATADRDTRAVPLLLAREAGWRLEGLWSGLGLAPREAAPLPVVDPAEYDRARETLDYRAFRAGGPLPETIAAEQAYDILVLGAESWRWDMLDPALMPRLARFAERHGWTSPAHYSTGNTTPEGLFGLFSGLSPLYWHVCQKDEWNPLLFAALARLGYRTAVWTSSDMGYKRIDRYVLRDHIDEVVTIDAMKYAETTLEWKRRPLELEDRAILDRYLERLEARAAAGGAGASASAAGRHFDLVYFYATHYNYYYPPSYERFTPALGPDFSAEDLALAERREELFNRYRNAVVYLDSLFGDALDRLEASGRLERTIVLVTGDHGQELFERGRFGHSMALNDYQVRVPLVLHIPGGRAREIRYRVTSHADIAPTLLAAIGADLDLERLFTGKDLLAYDPARNDAIVASQRTTGSPVEFALVEPGRKVYFANRAEDVTIGLATALDDEPLPPLDEAETRRIAARLLAEKRHFGAAAKLSLDPTATDLEGSR